MAPAVIAALISAAGSLASSYLNSRNRQPGPLGGPGGANSNFQPVSSSMAAQAVSTGSDVLSQIIRQKAEEEARRRQQEEQQRQQMANQSQQSVGQIYGGQSQSGGLRGILEMILSRAFR